MREGDFAFILSHACIFNDFYAISHPNKIFAEIKFLLCLLRLFAPSEPSSRQIISHEVMRLLHDIWNCLAASFSLCFSFCMFPQLPLAFSPFCIQIADIGPMLPEHPVSGPCRQMPCVFRLFLQRPLQGSFSHICRKFLLMLHGLV